MNICLSPKGMKNSPGTKSREKAKKARPPFPRPGEPAEQGRGGSAFLQWLNFWFLGWLSTLTLAPRLQGECVGVACLPKEGGFLGFPRIVPHIRHFYRR